MTRITVYDSGNKNLNLRLLIGTPTTGLVRMEWAVMRWGQNIPTNWSASSAMPGFVDSVVTFGYSVADAQNVIVRDAVTNDYEWVLFYEHDMLPPPDMFIRLNQYMRKADIPVVSGLYYTRSMPAEPILYRGRGNSYFTDWKLGDKVWVDGVPTGILLVHGSILKAMYAASEDYQTPDGQTLRKVFDVPVSIAIDPEDHGISIASGTTDLEWCRRVMEEDWFSKSGWPQYSNNRYPFLVDTNILCGHINPNGQQFPFANVWEALTDKDKAAQLEALL